MKYTITIITTILLALASIASAGSRNDIVITAKKAGSFNTLLAAAEAAGLVDALKADGSLTVFAPTDEAFEELPKGTVESLLKPENKDKLVDILTYHVVSGKVPFKAAVCLDSATALNEKDITVSVRNGRLFINESCVIQNDIETSNGIIHVIDSVLLPPADPDQKEVAAMLLKNAISKGVPLFNHGQHGACAEIYEIAAQAVAAMSEIASSDRKVLMAAIEKSSHSHSTTKRAWMMRHALDHVLESIH
jgi:uncharacterized surface protein with fasciclin (FAS1) repeats